MGKNVPSGGSRERTGPEGRSCLAADNAARTPGMG